MKALLSIEWLKIKHYRTFWVLIGLFILLLILCNYEINSGVVTFGSSNINIFSQAYTFPEVWGNVGFWTRFFSGLIAIIIIILTTNEYQYRTNRQNVIDGWKRLDFYHAKWGLVIALSCAVTLYTFLLGFIFGLANGSSVGSFYEHLGTLIYVFILCLNYFGFALTLSFFLKRSGLAILIFLLYTYIIEVLLFYYLNHKIDFKPGYFLPLQCSAEMLPFPIFEMLKKMIQPKNNPSEITLAITSLCWIAIYYFTGRNKLLKSDW